MPAYDRPPMPPTWLTVAAWVLLTLAGLTAVAILVDIYGRGHRQKMAVMEAVWPVTALYFGPLAWLSYRRWGRAGSPQAKRETGVEPDYGEPVSVGIGVSHCGAGCTLGDIVGAWLVFAFSWELLGLALPAEYVADFTLAYWFLMQLGMILGFLTAYPVNVWLIRRGVKEAM